MKTVELFSGTRSFSKVAEKLGHETFCIEYSKRFKADLYFNLLWKFTEEIEKKLEEADVVWMSPPCTTFSIAAGATHWTSDHKHKTEDAVLGKRFLEICWKIAEKCIENNKIFFIENPRARARWFLPKEYLKTVWYCQYGDSRAKPNDIWTNLKNWEGKQCFNGNKECHHESAPRGSKTGTQGLKGNKERSEIPEKLFYELFKQMEESD